MDTMWNFQKNNIRTQLPKLIGKFQKNNIRTQLPKLIGKFEIANQLIESIKMPFKKSIK